MTNNEKMNEKSRKEEITFKELVLQAKEWFHYLLMQWKIIVLAGLIGASIGVVYSIMKKPIYTASLSFVVEDEKSSGGLSGALGLASSFGFDFGGSGGNVFSGANLNEFFKSRKMVEQTLLTPVTLNNKTISLAEMYIENVKWRKSWKEDPKLNNIQFLPNANRKNYTRVQDSILGEISADLTKNNLSVSQKDKKISIISLEMISNNELFAKYFTEALAKEVSDFYIDTKSKKSQINMAILEKQTDSIRGELNKAITGVAVANDNTFNLNPSLNVRRTPSARRQVDVQANTAILTELVKQAELAKVTLRNETPLIQVIDRPILPLKKERFGKLKGIVIGGFVAGFFATLIILLKRILKGIF